MNNKSFRDELKVNEDSLTLEEEIKTIDSRINKLSNEIEDLLKMGISPERNKHLLGLMIEEDKLYSELRIKLGKANVDFTALSHFEMYNGHNDFILEKIVREDEIEK